MRINFNIQICQKGISLIELVIFIVILSIALTGITLIYINTTRHSADPLVRIRSIELAQATLDEILLKAYDDNTPVGGGCVQMSDATTTLCTSGVTPASDPDAAGKPLGAEEATRTLFDDVDDYHNQLYCGTNVVAADTACTTLTCQDLLDASGNNISALYSGFAVCIQVSFAGGELNAVAPTIGTEYIKANDAKRIDVIVTDPIKSQVGLSSYRLNF